jgi:outer membrane biosynthesis protein TonB
MATSDEKKNRRIALAVATGFQALLLLLFFFLVAWRRPDPPLPEYGIELDFGMDNQGSGQTTVPEPTPVVEEVVEEEATPEPTAEEIPETPVVEPEVEEVTEAELTEPEPEEPVEEVVTETQVEESPVVVEEVEESVKEVVAEPKPEPEPVPVPKQESLYPGKAAKPSNQGDDTKEIGDKGKEEGKIDERAIYGAKGSADGASLQMAGWNWDNIPRPNDSSNENGRIVFEITIDDQGEIIGVRTIEKTVSPTVERQYRLAVERLTFSTTNDNVRPAPTSTGRITFIIRAK